MSVSQNPFANEMSPEKKDIAVQGPLQNSLRWWPAAVLLAVMGTVKAVPTMMESPSLPVMMAGFMGPAVVGLLVVLWWLFASRASVKEKIAGFVGFVSLVVATSMLLHLSMQGMSTILYLVPSGTAVFGLVLIVFARQKASRLIVALTCAALMMGFWDLLQLKGVTGKFDAEFAWRWSPTAEQEYLRSLANRKNMSPNAGSSSDTSTADSSASRSAESAEVVTRASSAWSEFRGPLRDGKLPGITLNEDWKASPPKLIWKSKVGPGWSSFAVAGNRLFTQEQRGDNEAVVCLSADTGNSLWVYEYEGRFWESIAGAGPRATPTLADEGLFALGANGHLACLNPATGAVKWKRNIDIDSDRKPPQWGFSASPLVHSGLVFVHAGGAKDKGILAYDAVTGEPRWSVASGDHSYCSAQLGTFAGVEGILMQTNQGLQFLSIADGSTIWQHEWPVQNYRAIQPLVVDDLLLIGTSLGEGTRRITVKKESESWKISEDWTSMDMKPDFNDFVEYKGHVYGFDGNIFACIDLATGKRLWKKGRYGNGQVLLLPDAGQLLIASEKGELILVKADPAKLIEVGKLSAIEGKTWNHPVLVGNKLYMRNGEEAACYELSAATSTAVPKGSL